MKKWAILVTMTFAAVAMGQQTPVLPTTPAIYDATMPDVSTYKVVNVLATQSAQAAINNATCGTVIQLQAGAKYGPITLTNHNCDASHWIFIQSSAIASLPVQNTRVAPANAAYMAGIQAATINVPAVNANGLGTAYYRLVGLEITLSPTLATAVAHGTGRAFDNGLVLLGSKETNHGLEPHDLVVDRCYIHGTTTSELRRGIQLNGWNLAVVDSYISDIHETQSDNQAIATWGGTGPYKIVHNYLEAATENFLSGGATPSVTGEIPSDIEFRFNTAYKQLSWNTKCIAPLPAFCDGQTYGGIQWLIKNLFELKFAQRVIVEGNYFMHDWAGGQTGRAILFTPRCQGGTGTCQVVNATIDDVNFGYNLIYDMATGYELNAVDPLETAKAIREHRVWIHDNVWSNINRNNGGSARMHELLTNLVDVTITHNTGFAPIVAVYFDQATSNSQNLIIQNELQQYGLYGIAGTGSCGTGTHCLDQNTQGSTYTMSGNVLFERASVNAALYPATNRTCQTATCFPATNSIVVLTNYAACNATAEANLNVSGCALATGSPYKNQGTDGKDPGADIPTLLSKLAGH